MLYDELTCFRKFTRGQLRSPEVKPKKKQCPQISNSTRTDILILEVVHKVIFIHRSFIELNII